VVDIFHPLLASENFSMKCATLRRQDPYQGKSDHLSLKGNSFEPKRRRSTPRAARSRVAHVSPVSREPVQPGHFKLAMDDIIDRISALVGGPHTG
jgi:hypothetical protein